MNTKLNVSGRVCRVLALWVAAIGSAQAAPPSQFSGSYAGVMGCHMSAMSFTITVTPGEGQRIEAVVQGESVAMVPGQRAMPPAKVVSAGTYDPATGIFHLQAAPGMAAWSASWRGVVLAGGERVFAVPSDLDRAPCTPWAATRGNALPAAWATIPAEAAAGMAIGTKEGAEAHQALTQADAAQRECPAQVKEWLMQLHERGPKDNRRQSRQLLRNLYREPEFSARFGQPFATLPRQERLALAVQVNGVCRRDPALTLIVSQNRAVVGPLLNSFDFSAADVRAAGLAIDEARRWQAELSAQVDAALKGKDPLARLDALALAAQPSLALLWPDEAEAFGNELRRKRQPLLRPYLEAQIAADVASDSPWPRLNNFMARFEPQMRELGSADAAAVRELHAARLAAAKVSFDQQHAARVADAGRDDAERRVASPPPMPRDDRLMRPRVTPPDARTPVRPAAAEELLPPANGPFSGPGAPYANAIYQDDQRRLDQMDRLFTRMFEEQMGSKQMAGMYKIMGSLVGARGTLDDMHKRTVAITGAMGMGLMMGTSYMVSFEHIFPAACMDAEPLRYERKTEHSGTVARNIYGVELYRTSGWTERRYYRINRRFKEAFEASGANEGGGMAFYDSMFGPSQGVKLADALDSMRQGMRTMGCDSPDMKRFEANLLKRFWHTQERMKAAGDGKPAPR